MVLVPDDAHTEGAPATIELLDVSCRYGEVLALDRARLAIRPGEFFSVLGPSGCGKTTMLRVVAGFAAPSAGSVRIAGRDVTALPPHRRDVNTVFQQYALFPHLSVADNVAFGPRSRGLASGEVARRVDEALRAARIEELSRRRPSELSGGQRQRVALARALVNRPEALLLDEPLSALDPQLRRTMQIELKRLQRDSGIAFVFVTHDQQEALALSDRIAVLEAGRIRQIGSPVEVYEQPADTFVAGFIGQANLLDARVEERRVGEAQVRAAGTLVRVRVRVAGAGFAPGDPAVLVVRPEHVGVGRVGEARSASVPGGAGDQAVAAHVEEIAFEGPTVRCLLRAANGDAICALLPAREAGGFARGDAVGAYFAPEKALLLPPRDDAAGRAST